MNDTKSTPIDYIGNLRDYGTLSYRIGVCWSNNETYPETHNDFYENWFKGSIDEVIIFNRSLSDSEIKQIYDSQK